MGNYFNRIKQVAKQIANIRLTFPSSHNRRERMKERKFCRIAKLPSLYIHTMFLARFIMVCIPSSSCGASSPYKPCTIFQYVEPATGICAIPKYLFKPSSAAVVPPLLRIYGPKHAKTFFPGLI